MENLGFILGFEWHLSNKPLPSFSQYALGKPRGKSIFWNEKIKNSSLITTTIITMRTTTEENSPSRSWCLLAGLGGSHPDYGEQECFIVTNLSDLKGRFKKKNMEFSTQRGLMVSKKSKAKYKYFSTNTLLGGGASTDVPAIQSPRISFWNRPWIYIYTTPVNVSPSFTENII